MAAIARAGAQEEAGAERRMSKKFVVPGMKKSPRPCTHAPGANWKPAARRGVVIVATPRILHAKPPGIRWPFASRHARGTRAIGYGLCTLDDD